MEKQLPSETMKKAARGISYIAHPLRLRILEYLDVYGASCVSAITKGVREEQMIVSQSLRKLRDIAGDTFKAGVVLHDGATGYRHDTNLWALPISMMWSGSA